MVNVSNYLELKTDHELQPRVDLAVFRGESQRIGLEKGLTLIVTGRGQAHFVFRAQKKGERKQIKLSLYKKEVSKNDITKGYSDLKQAIYVSRSLQSDSKIGLHPVTELRSFKYSIGHSIDSIYCQFLKEKKLAVKSTQAIERVYRNEIKPYFGNTSIHHIAKNDVQKIIDRVLKSGRSSVAEKTLYLCKNLFDWAEENNICFNVTRKMTVTKNAGGMKPFKGVALGDHDLDRIFKQMLQHRDTFSETMFLYSVLLVALGLRKYELLSCKWNDYDEISGLLHIKREISKNKLAIAIPISHQLIFIMDRLKELSGGQPYIFPSQNRSKSGHLSPSTPNAALKRLFKRLNDSSEGRQCESFTIHDLRRTFRTSLSRMKIEKRVAELCINHRQATSDDSLNVIDRYDRYALLDERRDALDLVAERIVALTA